MEEHGDSELPAPDGNQAGGGPDDDTREKPEVAGRSER
jgi:hypothetical protein